MYIKINCVSSWIIIRKSAGAWYLVSITKNTNLKLCIATNLLLKRLAYTINALHNVTKAILQSDAQSKRYLWEIKVLRVLKAGLPWCVYIIFLTRISIYLFKLKKVIILLNWSKHLLGFNQWVGNETTYLMKKLTWSVKSFR